MSNNISTRIEAAFNRNVRRGKLAASLPLTPKWPTEWYDRGKLRRIDVSRCWPGYVFPRQIAEALKLSSTETVGGSGPAVTEKKALDIYRKNRAQDIKIMEVLIKFQKRKEDYQKKIKEENARQADTEKNRIPKRLKLLEKMTKYGPHKDRAKYKEDLDELRQQIESNTVPKFTPEYRNLLQMRDLSRYASQQKREYYKQKYIEALKKYQATNQSVPMTTLQKSETQTKTINCIDLKKVNFKKEGIHLWPINYNKPKNIKQLTIWVRKNNTGLVRVFSNNDLTNIIINFNNNITVQLSKRRNGLYVAELSTTQINEIK